MKIKKEYLILLVLIAALSVYLALRNTDRTHYRLPEVPKANKEAISKIELTKGDKPMTLTKEGEGWKITPEGFSADAAKVNGLLESIQDLSLTALVSEAKDYSRYDLSEYKRIRVRAWAADALKRDFDVGKQAPTFRHTFVKLAGDDYVYHAEDNFRNKFDVTADDLRDKTVLSFDKGEVNEITFVKGTRSLVLSKTEKQSEGQAQGEEKSEEPPAKMEVFWKSADGKDGNLEEINRALGDLSSLKCEKYLEGKKEDLKDPIYEVLLKGEKAYRLSIYKKQEKDQKSYPAVSTGNEHPFLLSDWRADQIMKDPEEWLAKSASGEEAQESKP